MQNLRENCAENVCRTILPSAAIHMSVTAVYRVVTSIYAYS